MTETVLAMEEEWKKAEAEKSALEKVYDDRIKIKNAMVSAGIFNLPRLLDLIPVGLRALIKGKLPPLFPHKAEDNKKIKDIAIKKAMKRLGIKEEMSFIGKVQEQIDEFGRESLLAENNMEVLKSIVKSKSAKNIKMKDGNLKMDLFTASAIMNIYDKVNPSNKKKIEALANGKKSDLMKLQSMAMKLHKK